MKCSELQQRLKVGILKDPYINEYSYLYDLRADIMSGTKALMPLVMQYEWESNKFNITNVVVDTFHCSVILFLAPILGTLQDNMRLRVYNRDRDLVMLGYKSVTRDLNNCKLTLNFK